MSFVKGFYCRAIADGILATRKLNGDPDVIAPNDPEKLKAIVKQGESAEKTCKEAGWLSTISYGHELGGKKDGDGK